MNSYRASDILKNARIEGEYSISEISKKTKIPGKYLEAIENGDCQKYPSEPYCSMFVNKYAQFLGLDSDKITSLFRRDFDQKPLPLIIKKQPVYLTPQFLFSVSIVILLIGMFTFLLGRYLSFNKPPSLTVNYPEKTQDILIKISGVTDPYCSVRINDDPIIIDQDGNFSKLIDISKTSKIVVEAVSPYGQKTISEHQYD